jgi:UDP-4-amino-4,6-dideoxy-N-acetyl-beta-L-altrosamine N-acetyltransferase
MITTGKLRPMNEGDLEIVLKWRNSDYIRQNMFSDHLISKVEHKAWFDLLKMHKDNKYLVFEREDKPFGLVYFTDIDEKNRRCYWGFYVGEKDSPKGTGTAMGLMGIEYAFETLGIRKIIGEVFVFNKASFSFFNRLGFKEEGQLKKHALKDGKYEDVIIFALFKEDWLTFKKDLEKRYIEGKSWQDQ